MMYFVVGRAGPNTKTKPVSYLFVFWVTSSTRGHVIEHDPIGNMSKAGNLYQYSFVIPKDVLSVNVYLFIYSSTISLKGL